MTEEARPGRAVSGRGGKFLDGPRTGGQPETTRPGSLREVPGRGPIAARAGRPVNRSPGSQFRRRLDDVDMRGQGARYAAPETPFTRIRDGRRRTRGQTCRR